MATVSNWIDHLNKPAEEVAGSVYPGAGSSEFILVLLLIAVWIGWSVITDKSEREDKNEELRPTKMRGVAFPKAKYGVILAIILIVVVNFILYKETIFSFFK
jgi:hypothetical protein